MSFLVNIKNTVKTVILFQITAPKQAKIYKNISGAFWTQNKSIMKKN